MKNLLFCLLFASFGVNAVQPSVERKEITTKGGTLYCEVNSSGMVWITLSFSPNVSVSKYDLSYISIISTEKLSADKEYPWMVIENGKDKDLTRIKKAVTDEIVKQCSKDTEFSKRFPEIANFTSKKAKILKNK